ncbi:MAG: hypothetical protein SOR95_10165 [Sutterella sp.]|nr:hypothetical protein [Sutterella sp.]
MSIKRYSSREDGGFWATQGVADRLSLNENIATLFFGRRCTRCVTFLDDLDIKAAALTERLIKAHKEDFPDLYESEEDEDDEYDDEYVDEDEVNDEVDDEQDDAANDSSRTKS